MTGSSDESTDPMMMMAAASGVATLVLASGLAYVMSQRSKDSGNVRQAEQAKPAVEELDAEKYPGGHVTIYYGSQTGTAESFAQQIAREGEEHGFKVHVVDLEDVTDDAADGGTMEAAIQSAVVNPAKADADGCSRAVFLMATYGEGEPTDNAAQFVAVLKEKAGISSNYNFEAELEAAAKASAAAAGEADYGEEKKGEFGDDDAGATDAAFFNGLSYAVFALGNRQYEHFCAMGKLADSALGVCGADRLAAVGIGDDDNDLEGDFENWKDTVMWPTLKKRFVAEGAMVDQKKSKATSGAGTELPDCPYEVEYLSGVSPSEAKADVVKSEEIHASTRHYFTAVDCPVRVSRELRTEQDPGSTVHMEIDISKAGDDVRYQTADNLGVLPVNDDDVVEAVAGALGYDLDAVFRLKPAPDHEHKHAALFPTPCTVRECLARYCDLTQAPRRSDLKLLASYATDPLDRSALLRMSSKEGKAEYREKIVNAHIGIGDIIARLCRSIEMPLEHFIAACPRLLPRYYTISSSSSMHPDSIHVTVSVVKTERQDGSVHKGVCSHHLAGIVENGTVRVFCRDSSFRLPKDPSRPVIMIGPGTGIAPMRALLQERSHQRKKRRIGSKNVGKNVLYFGCKTPHQDYLYEEELKDFEKEGTLNTLRVAFSRKTEKKVYVQHLLADDADETWTLVEKEKASVFVCGGTKMGSDVSETLRSIVAEAGGMSADEAKAYLDKMSSEGRFVQELWSA
eukprot:CAMPEP_0181074142 /NCGR_PEP_ID=MMETSP1070-20121207/29451_1 /TAXON_ID=265543 /ORGANISM="Minutocellus polymorphus, Strain NH13" /LENGTH=739 /DNA_ID=CAMNT_0023155253 /DNA_START=29 /DNA_END=2251 /DNA_ORIENTATION=+